MRALIFAAMLAASGAAYADPVTYTLDPAHTQVAFSVDRFGFNNVLGRFDQASGQVVLDEAHPQNSSVHAVVQVTSVSTGNDTRDGHLRGEHWLNVQQFATMEFQSRTVRLTGAHTADVTGDLTLLGQSHPLTLQVTLNRMGDSPANRARSAGFSATGTLSRAAWGSSTAANLIGDQVNITIEALAEVRPAAEQ
jgi:polyisoprenoid-binding protein YceI